MRRPSPTLTLAVAIAVAIALLAAIVPASAPALALSLSDLTNRDAAGGLREALNQGAAAAVKKLGRTDGYLGDPRVKIELPEKLQKIEGLLKMLGLGDQTEELVTAMNRAAEAAAADAKPILLDAVKKMTVTDAKGILSGGDDSVTEYFRRTTSATLTQRFAPIVRKATAKVKLASKYDDVAAKAARLGLVGDEDANIESYVTRKALDGLYQVIGDEERAIRQNPLGAVGSLAKKVFGALGH